jgi:hypothetical protein
MHPILLDELPGFTWWGGIGISIIIAIVSTLFKMNMDAQKKQTEGLEKDIKELQSDVRKIETGMTDIRMTILKEINEVGMKIADFRREIISNK